MLYWREKCIEADVILHSIYEGKESECCCVCVCEYLDGLAIY